MSGLENIINEIEQKSGKEADAIIREAERYCETYLNQEKEKISKEVAAFEKKSQSERELYENKASSAAEAMERNAILQAKQKNINLAIEKAYEKISKYPDKDYFQMMEALLTKNVLSKDGEILFGERDLKRMPSDFEDKIKEIAEKRGGSLKLVKEAADIPDGFILRYGMIEENCTLRALFDTKKDQLKDIALSKLFI